MKSYQQYFAEAMRSTKDSERHKDGLNDPESHKHQYDPTKDGETSTEHGHSHKYIISKGTTEPAGEDKHVHALN